jgi:metaxin
VQLHLWWIDGKTYCDFTRPWYAKIMPFPFNFFMPGRQQKEANLRVFLTKGGDNINDSDVETKVALFIHSFFSVGTRNEDEF